MKSRLALLFIVLGVAGTVGPNVVVARPVPFTVVGQNMDYHGCPHVRSVECARTAAEFTELMRKLCLPLPLVNMDFQHEMVIAYLMGSESPFGSYPEIVGVDRHGNQLTVQAIDHLACRSPSPSDPVVLLLVRKSPGEILLDREEQWEPGCP